MKFVTLFAFAGIIGSAIGHPMIRSRELDYSVSTAPSMAYDESNEQITITMPHGVGAGAGTYKMSVYTQTTGAVKNDPNMACPSVNPSGVTKKGEVGTTTWGYFTDVSNDLATAEWVFKVDDSIETAGTDLYQPYTSTVAGVTTEMALISFCVRLELYDSAGTGATDLVSWREIGVDLDYTLEDGINEVADFTTQAYGVTKAFYGVIYKATATRCDSSTSPLAFGTEVCIQVCPDDADSHLDYIKLLQFSDGADTQTAVDNSATPKVYELSSQDCTTVAGCCQVTTTLRAYLYPSTGEGSPPPTETISVTGKAILGLGARRELVNGRALEEEGEAEFSTEIELSAAENSAGSKTFLSLAAVGGSAAAALLI
jgi:hypothetical protein